VLNDNLISAMEAMEEMTQQNHNKIFGVGFNKTGTTAFGRCFDVLGLTPVTEPRVTNMNFLQFSHEIFKHGNYAPALYTALGYGSF